MSGDKNQLPIIADSSNYRSSNSLNSTDKILVYIDYALSVSCMQLSMNGTATKAFR